MTSAPRDITRLLLAWNNGDEAALEELTPLVYAGVTQTRSSLHGPRALRPHLANFRARQ